jgi:Ricin-type beta-trefoil lectin domain
MAKSRWVRVLIAAIVGGMSATVAVQLPAQAAVYTATYSNRYSFSCLDSNTARDVYVKDCNRGSFQKWVRNTTSLELRNLATGFCLDSNANGAVYAQGCNGGNFQKWRHYGFQFANIATGLCLDLRSNNDPYTHACNTGARQRWYEVKF